MSDGQPENLESKFGMQVYRLADKTLIPLFTLTLPTAAVLRTHWVTHVCARLGARTVLDIGGGNGDNSAIVTKFAEVTVLDPNAAHRDRLKALGIKEYIEGTIQEAGKLLWGRRFDVVLMCELLEHAKDQDEAEAWLKIGLKLGKTVVLTTPYERDWDPQVGGAFGNPDHKIYWTPWTLAETLLRAADRILYFDRMRWMGWSYFLAAVTNRDDVNLNIHPGIQEQSAWI